MCSLVLPRIGAIGGPKVTKTEFQNLFKEKGINLVPHNYFS